MKALDEGGNERRSIMSALIGFIVGLAVAYVLPLIKEGLAARRAAPPPCDDESRRRTERAAREYRNFLTYDGYARQDDLP